VDGGIVDGSRRPIERQPRRRPETDEIRAERLASSVGAPAGGQDQAEQAQDLNDRQDAQPSASATLVEPARLTKKGDYLRQGQDDSRSEPAFLPRRPLKFGQDSGRRG